MPRIRVPRIPAHDLTDAPLASRDLLEDVGRRTGKIMSIHTGMAHSPVTLAAHTSISAAIAEHGTFDARTREAIALAVGTINGCDYCDAAHTLTGRHAGLTADEMPAVRRGDNSFDPELGALPDVMRSAAKSQGTVDEDLWSSALEAGWSDTQLTEAFSYLMANLMTNFFNPYVEPVLDLPPAPPLR